MKVIDGTYPLLGSLIPIIKAELNREGPADNVFVSAKVANDELSRVGKCTTLLSFGPNEPYLHISDPKIVQELYTTNNKYFDKHPIVRDVTMRLLGNSILFADTDREWRKRRTAFSPAFYKGKLVQMVETAK
jgi:cytochrome P450